jgi:hypothetical protein
MKRIGWVGVLAALAVAGISYAAGDATTFQYLGAGKCKVCHMSAKKGAQYKVWSESKHAQAFAVLGSDDAKAIAKEKGIADAQKAPECLQCHVTGYGEPADHFAASFSESLGVQCESCHGPGSAYYKMTTMQDARAGKIDKATVGLLMPTKDTCAHCHNEKATGGKFVDWPADSAKIAHPIPAASAE